MTVEFYKVDCGGGAMQGKEREGMRVVNTCMEGKNVVGDAMKSL